MIKKRVKVINVILLVLVLLFFSVGTASAEGEDIPRPTPVSNGDEVMDTETGLVWQRCTLGKTGSYCSGGSANAYDWQQALQAASAPWRLPNINELRSIVEEKCYKPAINLSIFPETVSSSYWSASPHADYLDHAWTIYFSRGYSDANEKSENKHVRLVRGGQ